MEFKKPRRINIATIDSEINNGFGCSYIVKAVLKKYRDSYEINLYIPTIKRLHLSYYVACSVLNIVTYKKDMPPNGSARLLFQLSLPLDILNERIVVTRKYYGICISLSRRIASIETRKFKS